MSLYTRRGSWLTWTWLETSWNSLRDLPSSYSSRSQYFIFEFSYCPLTGWRNRNAAVCNCPSTVAWQGRESWQSPSHSTALDCLFTARKREIIKVSWPFSGTPLYYAHKTQILFVNRRDNRELKDFHLLRTWPSVFQHFRITSVLRLCRAVRFIMQCTVVCFFHFIRVCIFKKTKQKGVGRRECVSTSKIRVVNQRTNAWRPAINAPCSVTSGVYIIYNSTSSLQMLTKNIGRTEDTHTHTQKGGGFDSWTTIYYTITARTAQTL